MAAPPRNEMPFSVAIRFEGKPDKPIDIEAYLFDAAGAPLGSAPVRDGVARLAPKDLPPGARLVIGPSAASLGRPESPSLAALRRLDAYEPDWRYIPGREAYEVLPIPEDLWPHWPLCRCRVRGRVVKRQTSPGGVVVEAPICEARVHICEVDPLRLVIERLPEIDIWRLRDDLLDLIDQPIPWPPIPWPPIPGPDPGPEILRGGAAPDDPRLARAQRSAVTQLFGRADAAALNPQPLPPASRPGARLTRQPPPLAPRMVRLPDPGKAALMSANTALVRRALIDSIDLIRPWLCHWDWLGPWFYRCDELRVVLTDENGQFDTSISYSCLGDHPDLYFWVECSIAGVWTTVLKPSIGCNTWWDYACGSLVTLAVTDPRVTGCGPQPVLSGLQVVVKTIGRDVSMGEINRAGDPGQEGTVKPGWIDAAKPSPFGETVEPRVDFGTGLKPAGITHYRWSCRPLGSTSEADWLPITEPVSRHYRETAAAGDPPVYKSTPVGPDPAVPGYFFQVDPPLPAGGEKFEVLDERIDLASARWDTTKVATGPYELKLELFRQVAGVMTRVNLTAEGVTLSQISDPAPLSGGTYASTLASGDRLLTAGGAVVGYRLVLHVDNRPCAGTIDSVTVSPGANDTRCGFLEYAPGAQATLAFHASHPAGFASFSFSTARVSTVLASASAAGLVEAASVNGFARSGDLFTKSIAVSALLAEGVVPPDTPCIRAAFAESLHVYALATNGYGRLSWLDAPQAPGEVALRGFAVTPA